MRKIKYSFIHSFIHLLIFTASLWHSPSACSFPIPSVSIYCSSFHFRIQQSVSRQLISVFLMTFSKRHFLLTTFTQYTLFNWPVCRSLGGGSDGGVKTPLRWGLVLNRSTVKYALQNTHNDCYQWLSNVALEYTKFDFGQGSVPDPAGGAYVAPKTP